MKVVMLARESLPFHTYGGMQRYVWCLARYLANKGVEVELILPPAKNKQKIVPITNIKCTFIGPVVCKPFFWFKYFFFSLCASRYLSKIDFDILHGFEICPFFYLLKSKRKPVVVQTFGNEPLKTEGFKRVLHRLRWAPFFRSVVRRADSIGSIGDKQTEEVKELFGIPEEKIFYLPDGVDLERITELQSGLTKTRRDLGFEENDLVLICVSRLAPNKGIRYLIEAMDSLKKQHENIKLILVGHGIEENSLKRLIDKLGLTERVKPFKNIDDRELFTYYVLSDIFILPTLYEGLPLVLLEAEACGLPIITTNITDNAQLVKDGINGFLVNPKDPQAIARAVVKIYNDKLFNKMSMASKEIARGYDWSNVAKIALSKYEDMLKR